MKKNNTNKILKKMNQFKVEMINMKRGNIIFKYILLVNNLKKKKLMNKKISEYK